jgi:pyruvate dehydrogenase E2 component (dihydrolipoamide acetyltransferase)
MATAVEMPKLGNTVDECRISHWHVRKGDQVAAGDVLADIETDKTNFELTAPVGGSVLDLFFDEDELVPVFANLCVIGEAGESVVQFRSKPDAAVVQRVEPRAAASSTPLSASPTDTTATPYVSLALQNTGAALSPRARRFAAEHDFYPRSVVGSGPGGRVLEEDLRKLFFAGPRVSSAARRRIDDGSELRGTGTGIGGMVLAADLGPPATRMSSMRERIARRMRESLAGTAQYTLQASANAAGLLAVRKKVKASAASLPDININDLVIFCTIQALLRMPALNAEFIDGKLFQHAAIHIGFAVDTDRGLLVPVVHDSQKLTVAELSVRLKDLASRAVRGTISSDELSGGTFTVSNLGSLGIESFTPLLNPPQVAILGVNAITLVPVRTSTGSIDFIDAVGFSLTCDHQVIDGAPGARFLRVLKEMIEDVETLCTILS